MKYVLVVLFAVALFLCCADDIIVEKPMEIPGDYTGTLTIHFPKGDSGYSMQVNWTFTLDSGFYYAYTEGDDQICDGNNGEFGIVGSQMIIDTVEADLGRTCNTSWMPKGQFGMILQSRIKRISLTKDSTYSGVQRVTTIVLDKVVEE